MHLAQFLSSHKGQNLQTCSIGTSGKDLSKAAMHKVFKPDTLEHKGADLLKAVMCTRPYFSDFALYLEEYLIYEHDSFE